MASTSTHRRGRRPRPRAGAVVALCVAVVARAIGVLALETESGVTRTTAAGGAGQTLNASTTTTTGARGVVEDIADEEEAETSKATMTESRTRVAAEDEDARTGEDADSAADVGKMNVVEDENEEDKDDSTTTGAGGEEVRSADETFETASVTRQTSSSTEANVDDEKKEEEKEELSEDEMKAAIEKAVKKRLAALYAEPTPKQKDWVKKVKEIHSLDGAVSFTEDGTTCGSTGGLAVFTIWDHVPDVARDAITKFVAATAAESTSPHSLLSLRVKAIRLVKAYDVSFKGTGADRNDCIANYFVRQKVHEVMHHINRRREDRIERAHETFDHTLLKNTEEDTSEEAEEERARRIGRVAKELKRVISAQLDKTSEANSDEKSKAGGTTLVLSLNCRAQHQHRLVAAIMHAVRARFGLGAGDFTMVIGKKAVDDELQTLLGKSYDTLMSQRDAEVSANAVQSRIEVCPSLPGIPPKAEEPERPLSEMEKAMRSAEQEVMLEHQNKDPTNPYHQNAGAGLGIQSLPGMPNVFNGQNLRQQGDGTARDEARQYFGLNDHSVGTHNTDHLRGGQARRQPGGSGEPRQKVQGGFNALPKMADPLDDYLRSDAKPRRYQRRAVRN